MSNETTQNFLEVMASFKWPDPKPISYRLYYNDDGTPKCYTMDDLPGKYIEVDRDTYISHLWNVRVVDNSLKILPQPVFVQKLKPNTAAGTCCDPNDVCVIVEPSRAHLKWSVIQNETY